MLVTVADIRRQACRMADRPEPVSGSTDWLETSECLDQINHGLAELQGHISAHAPDVLTARADLTVAVGDQWVMVPGDLLEVREVYLLDSGGTRISLGQGSFRDLGGSARTDTEVYPTWQLLGNRLWLSPSAGQAGTLEVWYVRAFAPLLDDTDEIRPEIPPGWELYAVGHLAAYIMGKGEQDPSPAVAAMQRVLASIQDHAARRGGRRSLGGRISGGKGGRADEIARLPYPMR